MKKRLLCGLFIILLLAGCSAGMEKIRFASAGLGGVYHSFATNFVQLLSEDESISVNNDLEVKTTAGSAANLRLLSDNYVQLAIVQADQANDAYYGKGIFEDQALRGYGAITTLYPEACQIVVRKDSDITSIDELMGKNVSIGESDSGTEQNALQILQASGLNSDLVNEVHLNYTDAAEQLRTGEIDAFFCTAGVETTVIDELSRNCEIRLLSIDEDCAEKLTKAYGFYIPFTIPAGTYSGQDEEVQTLGIQSLLLANDKLSSDTVKELTDFLFSHRQELQYSVSVDLLLDENAASDGITIPFHPGAIDYYQECGITIPDTTPEP